MRLNERELVEVLVAPGSDIPDSSVVEAESSDKRPRVAGRYSTWLTAWLSESAAAALHVHINVVHSLS